jgi:hypothetical protein
LQHGGTQLFAAPPFEAPAAPQFPPHRFLTAEHRRSRFIRKSPGTADSRFTGKSATITKSGVTTKSASIIKFPLYRQIIRRRRFPALARSATIVPLEQHHGWGSPPATRRPGHELGDAAPVEN